MHVQQFTTSPSKDFQFKSNSLSDLLPFNTNCFYSKDSFDIAEYWKKSIDEHAPQEGIVKYLVGNKSDIKNSREITYE